MKEDDLQEAIFQWLHLQPVPGIRYAHAIPNGGFRKLSTAVRLKKTGVKKGVLDICFLKKTASYSGFLCEVKVGKNKPTKEQKEYAAWCLSQGFYTCLVYDLESFIAHFEAFLRS